MSDMSAPTKSKLDFNEQTHDQTPDLDNDLRAQKTENQRQKISGLGSIRISSPAKKMEAMDDAGDVGVDMTAIDAEITGAKSDVTLGSSLFLIASIVWIAYGVGYFIQGGIDISPQGIGGLFMTLFAPPALLWYVFGQLTGRNANASGNNRSSRYESSEFNGDVEAFYQQAAEISQMSKAVLKSLQRARQGLRVEMRDFSGVSKKAEFHIDRLSDALHSKSEKITALTQSLEGKIDVIESKALASTSAWDSAIDKISARSGEIEDALMSGADKILDAADRAHLKTSDIKETIQSGFDDLNDAVESVSSQLEGVSTRFEGHTDSINDIVDHVSRETERMTDTIKTQINDLESSAGRTVASVIDSANTISSHKEEMERGVRDLYNQSELVSDLVKRSVSDLKDSVDYVSQHSGELEDRLEKRSADLKSTVDGLSKQADMIEEVGDQAANKLAESLSIAVGGAESISFAIRRAVESLEEGRMKASEDADKIVAGVMAQLNGLNAGAEENNKILHKANDLLSGTTQDLSSTVENAHRTVDELMDRVERENSRMEGAISSLSGSVSSVGNTLSQSIRDIQNAVNDVDSRHHVIDSVITRRVSDLSDASDRALKVVDDIRTGLRGQLQEVASLTGQLSSQGRSINDNMTVQKEQMAQLVEKTLSDMASISVELDTQISKVKDASSLSDNELGDIVNNVSESYEKLQRFGRDAEGALESLDGVLMAKLSSLYDQSDKAKESFVSLSAQIADSADSMSPVCDEALEKAHVVKERFLQLRDECSEVSESNLHKFQQFGILLESNLNDLKAGSEEASRTLESVNDVLVQRASALREASDTAVDNVENAANSLRDQTETIHLLGDQAVVKMDSVQKEINSQFMDFSESVAGAILELEKAGDQFSVQSESVQGEITDNITVMKTAGVKAREEVFMLSEATQKVAQDTNVVIADIEDRMNEFLGGAQVILTDFKKTGDTISIRSRELSEQMRASLQTSEMYGREIKGQVSSIAGSSLEVAEQIGKAISMLNGSMDNIGRAAHDTTDHIFSAREKLSIEADRLMQVSSAALNTTKDASDSFSRQSESMFKAVRDVQEATNKLKAHEAKSERSAFLSSSRFIVESLHSLSVDVSRMLEGGNVSEKAWQAFQRGDVSVFTRKLAALGENWPIERAQDKFRKDSEFRTYVQRFIRQFEEVYEQASANDHGALLSVTIGSSDIAKLYTKLCKIALRENKISKLAEDKRVA